MRWFYGKTCFHRIRIGSVVRERKFSCNLFSFHWWISRISLLKKKEFANVKSLIKKLFLRRWRKKENSSSPDKWIMENVSPLSKIPTHWETKEKWLSNPIFAHTKKSLLFCIHQKIPNLIRMFGLRF